MVDAVTSPTTNTQSQTLTGSSVESQTTLSSDFETFLQMLTVQMQNQDPLNPVDSTEYATQLATFSAVEQQALTNELLIDLTEKITGSVLQEYSSWLGMEALVQKDVFYGGAPISVRPEYATGADKAELLIRDSDDNIVQRFDVDVSQDSIVWGGYDENGDQLPFGNYRFEVASYNGETLLNSQTAPVFSRIGEVRAEGNNVLLTLSDGSEVSPGQISSLRSPQ
ncbi:MAG: flagellin biosynthesis protein FlgD [Pelagimonas sp.]|jgi:flagellar basal-body rod modification protein FlgD|nr:flagellin biosynthesis protein FlgD [Pelagimonas sp.]